MAVRVSVLMAAYNAEKYLRESLDSVLSQDIGEGLQLICIDDASTDGTAAILDDYASHDNRMEVIHLEQNGGAGRARNIGLKQVRGRYVAFVDADDLLGPDALRLAAERFDADPALGAVLFKVRICDEQGRVIEDYPMDAFEEMPGTEAFEKSLTWQIHGVYVVRADIHLKYPYDETSRTFSDDNTTRLHYLASERVGCCEGVYYYRQHSNSVTHVVDISRFDYLKANASMARQLRELNQPRRLLSLYEAHRWNNLIGMYMFYVRYRGSFSSAECRASLRELRTAWQGIDTSLLPPSATRKFGYMPLRSSWPLFRLQEEIYFLLRRIKYGKKLVP